MPAAGRRTGYLTRAGACEDFLGDDAATDLDDRIRRKIRASCRVSAGEIALVWPELRAAFVSDLVWGGPSGSLSFLPDEVLADPPRAALELRKLLAYPEVETILVGDGDSIFGNGRERLLECLVAREDIWLA